MQSCWKSVVDKLNQVVFIVCVFKLNSCYGLDFTHWKASEFCCDEEFLVRISVKTLTRKEQTTKATFLQIQRGCESRKKQRQTLCIIVNHERSKQKTLKDAEVEFRVARLFFFEHHGIRGAFSTSSPDRGCHQHTEWFKAPHKGNHQNQRRKVVDFSISQPDLLHSGCNDCVGRFACNTNKQKKNKKPSCKWNRMNKEAPHAAPS